MRVDEILLCLDMIYLDITEFSTVFTLKGKA